MKKAELIMMVSLLALCLLFGFGFRQGVVESQTTQPETTGTTPEATPGTTPSGTTPAATTAAPSETTAANRPISRWVTANGTFLTTLINDANLMLSYLKEMNLAYAEIACPQLLCDIRTLQGRAAPTAWMRSLMPCPSGYRCPPIPDAQTAADLNAGMSWLEQAINHIIDGENALNGDMVRTGEAETQIAVDHFTKVLQDLQNVPSVPSEIVPATSTPFDTIRSFMDAVQNGDMDVVSVLTGGEGGLPGVNAWCAKGLSAFVGHTTFGTIRWTMTHNDDKNACVNVDGFMTFTDPAGFAAVVNTCHFWIDGDFKFKAVDGKWIITSLPDYQEPNCDSQWSWGPDPTLFPTPGDAI